MESAAFSQALHASSEEPSLSERVASSMRGSESSSSSALSALTAEIVECREVDEILEVVSEEAGQSLAPSLMWAKSTIPYCKGICSHLQPHRSVSLAFACTRRVQRAHYVLHYVWPWACEGP